MADNTRPDLHTPFLLPVRPWHPRSPLDTGGVAGGEVQAVETLLQELLPSQPVEAGPHP